MAASQRPTAVLAPPLPPRVHTAGLLCGLDQCALVRVQTRHALPPLPDLHPRFRHGQYLRVPRQYGQG
eukprot:scaffold4113_cov46-Phaeocystis_antarctica.AAC.3